MSINGRCRTSQFTESVIRTIKFKLTVVQFRELFLSRMKLTQIFLRQHIGRMFKRHWVVQGKKVPVDNGSISELAKISGLSRGDSSDGILDAVEFVSGKTRFKELPKVDLSGVPPIGTRKSNLNCKSEFLIEGLDHAGCLTKTAIINHLPAEVQKVADAVQIPSSAHDAVRMTILRDQLYEYRPYKCDPQPMTLSRLLESCERLAGGIASLENIATRNTYFSVPIRRSDRTLSFETTIDHVIWRRPSSSENISLVKREMSQVAVPSISPLAFDASLFANVEDIPLNYPVNLNKMQIHPQMIVLRSRPEEMKTFHETDASDTQFKSRALMSSFVVAASTAISSYGANVKRLPKPVVIHSVLNHENRFYFGCFQLNTLDLNDDKEAGDNNPAGQNYWFHSPAVEELYWIEPPKVRNPVFPHHREIGEGDLFKLAGYNEQILRTMVGQYSQFTATGKRSGSGQD